MFAEYLFSEQILSGLAVTLELSFSALVIGLVVGTIIAAARLADNTVVASTAAFYVWLLRGLPAIVQLLFWGNIALFIRQITIAVPFTDVVLLHVRLSDFINPFIASVLGLGLAESAYMSEIIRGGIASVDKGQFEASSALGMGRVRRLRRIILPQAMRAIIPALGNQFANVVKASAIVAVIAGGDLLTVAQNIAAENYHVLELLFVASFWYLAVLAILGVCQSIIER
ncbi:MAG: amino acid ABC transporter permease, partial [Xanthobacteraceae bacterium]|nr:amino acid ABC transporter permease [Xanthobacteraceae bacterium]